MGGHYRVITKLGQGGMANAFLALNEGPGGFRKLSVVKQLRLDLCNDPEFVTMFLEEARIAALLHHPNVVQTHEVGAEDGVPFMAMEYLQGQAFSRARRRLPVRLHLRVIAEVLNGLHYVHELMDLRGKPLGVVHRDISPSNLFLTYDGGVKVLDFGIAKVAGSQVDARGRGFKGKISYVAPEQIRTTDVDRRADIFSVGVLLWEALAGRSLAPRDQTEAQVMRNRVMGLEPSIDEVAPRAPAALRDVCNTAMALDPDRRFSTARQFRDALEVAVGKIPTGPCTELASTMSALFKAERKAIDDAIAKTISGDDEAGDAVAALGTWNAFTSKSKSPPYGASSISSHGDRGSMSAQAAARHPAPTVRNHNRSLSAVVIGVTVFATVGAYFVYAVSSSDPSPAKVASSPPRPSEVASSALPIPDAAPSVELRISVKPRHATLTLDGQELAGNPYVSRGIVAEGEHELVAEAPGYETLRRRFRLDDDLDLDLRLEATPARVAAAVDDDDTSAADASEGERRSRSGRRGRQGKRERDRAASARVELPRVRAAPDEGLDGRRAPPRAADDDGRGRRAGGDDGQADKGDDGRRAEARDEPRDNDGTKPESAQANADDGDESSRAPVRPGDSLRGRVRRTSRTIDKHNPYDGDEKL
jgi:serine/threonine-protein kinase